MAKAPADIRSLARKHTKRAIETLQGIMDQPKAPYAARVAAAQALLDRGWGKPAQDVNLSGDVNHNYVARMPDMPSSTEEWQNQHAPKTIQ